MTHPPPAPATILDRPLVAFGREVCGDFALGLRREWLVTNGLGGYASGTIAGPNTRRYHGLLVAALTPPVGRTILVGGSADWATYNGRRWPLCAHEWGDGSVDPHGYRYLESFALEGLLPVWTFALADALLERRVWMARDANTTYVRYHLLRGAGSLDLEITPLITCRDFHSLSIHHGWRPEVTAEPRGAIIHACNGQPPFRLLADDGYFEPSNDWYWNFRHREETARGLDNRSNLYAPGAFRVTIEPGASFTLVFTIEDDPVAGWRALEAARDRQQELLRRANARATPLPVQQLILAADQFIVERRAALTPQSPLPPAGEAETPERAAGERDVTVIAGYPWFNDWGRDMMIALPGLTLSTGRPEDAASILRGFARYVRDGLLPNNFPDHAGVIPGYNTVDATLWYVVAIHTYAEATGDDALVNDLLPALREIVERHIAGTRYGIGADPDDSLLRAGELGVQLTWMDAKVGDWVVTPRIGKPVEINALWYNALRILSRFLGARNDGAVRRYDTLAGWVRDSFRTRFIQPGRGHLADVVDGPDGDDWALRPNQIFAVSLPFPLLEGAEARSVVDAVGRALLTSYGLRSLAPDDPAYHGDYHGDQVRRDGAYHQGPVWAWLIGAYAEAYARAYDDPDTALTLLAPFAHHLFDAGLGSISEILEGDPPHLPRGCVAQAWSVAEVLRVWRALAAR